MTPLIKDKIVEKARQKKHRKRSVAELHEHFEHFCNAAFASRLLLAKELK